MKLEQLPFMNGNRLIFTDRQHATTTPLGIDPPPAGWNSHDLPGWTSWTPEGYELPRQGWKLHVSATRENCHEIFAIVSEYCLTHRVPFKHVPTVEQLATKNGKYSARGGSGKFLTLYPATDEESVQHADALATALAGFQGPYILTDLRWRDSVVFLRYGAYVLMKRTNPDTGQEEMCVQKPDGSYVLDDRSPVFAVPEWVTPPPAIQAMMDERDGTDGWLPFTVNAALHHSNGGGVYRGELHERTVVVKEARSLTGVSYDGCDAQTRLRRESTTLLELGAIPGVPRHYGFFRVWEHEFLCMEEAPGQPFTRVMAQQCPLSQTASQASRDDYVHTVQNVITQIEAVLSDVHAKGYVYGDISPANVIVDTEQSAVMLIDWEASQPVTEFTRGLATPGFLPPGDLEPTAQDLFGLVRLAYHALCPLVQLCEISPSIVGAHREFIASYFGQPAVDFIDELTHRCFPDGFPDTPTPLQAGGVPTVEDLACGIEHLWGTYGTTVPPLSIEEFDPSTRDLVWTGSAGLAMALRTTGHGLPELDRIVAERMSAAPSTSLGFFKGLGGQTTFLTYHDQPEAERFLALLLAQARAAIATDAPLPIDLSQGTSGLLLSALAVERHAPGSLPPEVLEQLSQRVVRDLPPRSDEQPLPAGLESGWSGAAIALIAAAQHLENTQLLTHARRAIDHDLARCVVAERDGSMLFDEGQRVLPYPGLGSLGIALAAQELQRVQTHDDLHEPLTAIAKNLECSMCVMSGLLFGRAGLLLASKCLDQQYLPAPRTTLLELHTETLRCHTFHDDHGAYLAGDQNTRLSSDYAYGSAGIMLALQATGTEFCPWLPFTY